MYHRPNKKYFETAGVPEYYGDAKSIVKAEELIYSSLRNELKDKPILDLGVGGGRTTPHLRAISRNYIGADYSEKMIALCRQKFADATFEVCDATRMSIFQDEQFAAVFILGSGIDEVSKSDRIVVLREIYRVLKSNGIFVLSCHNLDSNPFAFSGFSFSPRPAVLISDNAKRLMIYAGLLLSRLWIKLNKKGHAVIIEYQYLPKRKENAPGMIVPTYYIKKDAQRQQLLDAGFSEAHVLSMNGLTLGDGDSPKDMFLHYIVRKV